MPKTSVWNRAPSRQAGERNSLKPFGAPGKHRSPALGGMRRRKSSLDDQNRIGVGGRARPVTRAARIAVLLTVAALVPTASPADAILYGRFRSSGANRTYAAYVPPNGHPHPLVILLHGSGGTGRDMVERWRGLAGREGILVAAPDATDPRRWQ